MSDELSEDEADTLANLFLQDELVHDGCDVEYNASALRKFLESLMTNYEFFLHGKTTSYTESFHNVCNKYYKKSLSVCYGQYKMRKEMAALDWNEQIQNKFNPTWVPKPLQRWQYKVLRKFKVNLG